MTHERTSNINMTGHTILVPGLELADEIEHCERGPLDAPDMIPAGYWVGPRHVGSIVCMPVAYSVSRE